MIDRKKAIEAAMAANGWCSSEWRISAERIVDAVLALPIVVDDAMVERAAYALKTHLPEESRYFRALMARAALEAALNPSEPGA